MALANLVGFDLAPRLAGMNKRKLYLPRGLDVPASLQPIVSETVSTRAITRGWDSLLRIAASTKRGTMSKCGVIMRLRPERFRRSCLWPSPDTTSRKLTGASRPGSVFGFA